MTPVHPVSDEWDAYLAYLRHTGSLTERVYQLDKEHGFDGAGTPEGKQFTAERLAAGASMLRDLIYSAWIASAQPVPQWHANERSGSAISFGDQRSGHLHDQREWPPALALSWREARVPVRPAHGG